MVFIVYFSNQGAAPDGTHAGTPALKSLLCLPLEGSRTGRCGRYRFMAALASN